MSNEILNSIKKINIKIITCKIVRSQKENIMKSTNQKWNVFSFVDYKLREKLTDTLKTLV